MRMSTLNFQNKKLRLINYTESGKVTADTLLEFFQKNGVPTCT
jgi:hypothetical protein